MMISYLPSSQIHPQWLLPMQQVGYGSIYWHSAGRPSAARKSAPHLPSSRVRCALAPASRLSHRISAQRPFICYPCFLDGYSGPESKTVFGGKVRLALSQLQGRRRRRLNHDSLRTYVRTYVAATKNVCTYVQSSYLSWCRDAPTTPPSRLPNHTAKSTIALVVYVV